MITATLFFSIELDDRAVWEIELKGWFEGASAKLSTGRDIPLSFWDPIRLQQEVTAAFASGKHCFTEPMLVILPSVTPQNMKQAIEELSKQGFFDRLNVAP